tara:strand:+ start:2294 stop:2431 length:138 start_codon:yes stop_codon:yes gene_type:complete
MIKVRMIILSQSPLLKRMTKGIMRVWIKKRRMMKINLATKINKNK